MQSLRAKASARVDLAGGTLDLWPLGVMVPGAVTVNVALNLAASVECVATGGPCISLSSQDLSAAYEWRPGQAPGALALAERLCEHFGLGEGWSIATRSDVPPGSGLGGSSAMTVALALALRGITGASMDEDYLVGLCRDVEAAHLGIPTGVQDYWPALRGGVLALTYPPGRVGVERLPVSLDALAGRLVVAYSGESRLSADSNWSVYRRFVEGDAAARRGLDGIAAAGRSMREALVKGDLDRAAAVMDEEWRHRASLTEGVTTPAIEHLMEAARGAGALGAKACGAGGGGCLAFLVKEGTRYHVEEALERNGARVLPAHPAQRGFSLEVYP